MINSLQIHTKSDKQFKIWSDLKLMTTVTNRKPGIQILETFETDVISNVMEFF
jgi:hypothetical protein